MMCPRRVEGAPEFDNGPDRWVAGRGLVHQGQEPSCSFCGSLHPDRFMELVRAGWVVGPTDKSYKAYLHAPLTEQNKATRKAIWERKWRQVAFTSAREDTQTPTPAEVDAELARLWDKHGKKMAWEAAYAGPQYKFYFQHLNSVHRAEFVALYNDEQMSVGYPGHFYITPYFCVTGELTK